MKCLYSKASDTKSFNSKEVERYYEKIADTLSLENTFQNYIEFMPSDDEAGRIFLGVITLDIINERVNIKAIQDDMLSKFNINISGEVIKEILFFAIIPRAFKFVLRDIERQQKVIEKIKESSQTYYYEAFMLMQAPFKK